MQDLKISMKARTSWINVIKRIDGIFGCKVLYGESETKSLNSGRECGEALDPMSNLQYRLESSVVLVEDKSSSLSEQCQAIESVITRTSTPQANPSSPVPSPIFLNLCQYLDSSIPISPKVSSYSSSGISSDASSIHDVADHSEPLFEAQLPLFNPIDTSSSLTISMEEAEDDTHAKTDDLLGHLATFEVKDVIDRETIQDCKDKLDNFEKLLEDSNVEIKRLNAANVSLQAQELELLERQVVAQEAMSTLLNDKTMKEVAAKKHSALVEAKAKARSILFDVAELNEALDKTRDWKNASDYTVKKAMRNINEWKEDMKKIIKTKGEFMILVEKNNFTDDDVKKYRVEREVDGLKADVDAAILSIENEDNFRALYSLDTTPVRDPVKLPKFSGKDGEDFHVFKEEMNRGFVQNRIPRAN